MRLLDVHQLKFKEFNNDNTRPPYAILSHTWGDGEVSFQDIHIPAAVSTAGYVKIKKCCEVAIQDGFEYVWIDTCCIDKTSSAELSEAINSMYNWYQSAAVCYTYLSDVQGEDNPSDPESSFPRSRWFTRGWTLQELLAPNIVIFFDRDWAEIGTKHSLQEVISRITHIPRQALLNEADNEAYSIAQRMSWAAMRETTRVEDIAYCLIGIFNVNMPSLYGEGRKAFIRLQLEIMKFSDDHSLFAWVSDVQELKIPRRQFTLISGAIEDWEGRLLVSNMSINSSLFKRTGLLSSSPRHFRNAQGIQALIKKHNESDMSKRSFSMTNNGIHIWLPMIDLSGASKTSETALTTYQVIFNCDTFDGNGALSVYLQREPHTGRYFRILSNVICRTPRVRYNALEPVELFVRESYPGDFNQDMYRQFKYHLHLVENTSPKTGYTLTGSLRPEIFQQKMITLRVTEGVDPVDMSYFIVGPNSYPSARVLVALGVSCEHTEKPSLFCIIRSEKLQIEHAIDKFNIDNLSNFRNVFGSVNQISLGERIIEQLPRGQRVTITFRIGPGSGGDVQVSRLIVEFTPTPAGPPPLPRQLPALPPPLTPPPKLTLIIINYVNQYDKTPDDTCSKAVFIYPEDNWSVISTQGRKLVWAPTMRHKSAIVGIGTAGVLLKLVILRVVGSDIKYEMADPPSDSSTWENVLISSLNGDHVSKASLGSWVPYFRRFRILPKPPRYSDISMVRDQPEEGYTMAVTMVFDG